MLHWYVSSIPHLENLHEAFFMDPELGYFMKNPDRGISWKINCHDTTVLASDRQEICTSENCACTDNSNKLRTLLKTFLNLWSKWQYLVEKFQINLKI